MSDNTSCINLLLEIGTEEIPAGFLSDGISAIEELAVRQLTEATVTFSNVKVYATPRRIAVIVSGVAQFQRKNVKEVFGPPVSAAYDGNGNPTKAALGFAATHSIDVSQLSTQTRGKGRYIVARIEEPALAVKEIVGAVFERMIAAIRFPKMMRWASMDVKFARPVCWITAVCGNEPVSLHYGGIDSSNRKQSFCKHYARQRVRKPFLRLLSSWQRPL